MIDPIDAIKHGESFRNSDGTIVWPPHNRTGGQPLSDDNSAERVNNAAREAINSPSSANSAERANNTTEETINPSSSASRVNRFLLPFLLPTLLSRIATQPPI